MKKQILLITPENREIHSYRKKQFNNFIQLTMPYLSGFIDERNYDITLIDEYNQTIPYGQKFDLVAITVNTPNANHCYGISRRFRQNGAKVVMGGPHVTLMPDEAMQYCDYLIAGEAEESWPQFLEAFYHGNAQSRYSCKQPPTLQRLPIARRDLIKRRKYTKGAVFASRGCPYNCRYCNLKQIYCPSFRMRPIPEVIRDIQTIEEDYFVFWDDNFFGNIDYARQLMLELKPLRKKWAAQVTIDRCEDEELLGLAKESGCLYFFIGLESFSVNSLASMNKEINHVAAYGRIIQLIHRCGISVWAGIIFGFDTDDRDVFRNTLIASEKVGIDGVTPSILTPLPGTPLFDEWRKEGRLLYSDWTYYNGKTRVSFQPKQMTAEELYQGYTWFRNRFYSFRSILKRIMISRTNVIHNLLINIGYKLSL
ncbi:MAG TPA: radical SAM protein [Syntrophales bacterium]|nr:radical SAM protein [Syntrophales bacterium]